MAALSGLGPTHSLTPHELLLQCRQLSTLSKAASQVFNGWKPAAEPSKEIATCLQLQTILFPVFISYFEIKSGAICSSSAADAIVTMNHYEQLQALISLTPQALAALKPFQTTESTTIAASLRLQTTVIPSLTQYFSALFSHTLVIHPGRVSLEDLIPWIGQRIQIESNGSRQEASSQKLDALVIFDAIRYMAHRPEKQTYNGERSGSALHGQGKLTFGKTGYDTQGVYQGDFSQGQITGQGTCTYPDGGVYKGPFFIGCPDGEGLYQFPSTPSLGQPSALLYGKDLPHASAYEGSFKILNTASVFSGQGKITFVNGQVYEGSWNNGLPHGQGRLTFKDGSYYDGLFTEGRLAGWCSIAYLKDERQISHEYVGQADHEGQPHGYGWLPLASQTGYEGEFCHGKFHGTGALSYFGTGRPFGADSRLYFQGQFVDGQPHGQGTFTSITGDCTYSGEFYEQNKAPTPSRCLLYSGELGPNQNLRGYGTISYANGDVYVGTIDHGQPHGQGTLTGANGKTITGKFAHGKSQCTIQ